MQPVNKLSALVVCLCSIASMANEHLKFDVKMPSKISIKKELAFKVSFTNKSKKPILVPEYLFYDKDFYYSYYLYDKYGQQIIPGQINQYLNPRAFNNKRTLLAPGKTRFNTDWLNVEAFFHKLGRYRIVFYWDGFLDGNTEGELSRFSCEKWIEVTE
jgi:hypothetical protein